MTLVDRFIALSEIDTRRMAFERKLSQAPGIARQADARARQAKDAVQAFKDAAKKAQLEMKRAEADLKAKQADLEKNQIAQNQAKGNEEFRLLGKKIDGLKDEIGAMEMKILEELERQDSRGPELASLEKAQKDAEAEAVRINKDVEAQVAGLKADHAKVMAERQKVAATLDAKTLEVYKSALDANGDTAVALVQGSTCQGCNMSVRPNQISLLKGREQLITCQCGRVLYLEQAPT
jgi:predicted  nucleic acid-binding Zn-ribbon protein